MTEYTESTAAGNNRQLVVRLSCVSVAVLLVVLVFTRGTSKQLVVEGRIAELVVFAERDGLSLPLFVALCVTEAYAADPRDDDRLAELLKTTGLSDYEKLVPDDFALLLDDPVQRKFVIDLLNRNRERWIRLSMKR